MWIFKNQQYFTALMQSARPDSALVPFCILSVHLNVTLGPAPKPQEGNFWQDFACGDPLHIPVERQGRKRQVCVPTSKAGGLILDLSGVWEAQACAQKPRTSR